MTYFFAGCAFWGVIAFLIYAVRPKAFLSITEVDVNSRRGNIITAAVLIAVILVSTLPMSLSPVWNGDIPEFRNQYEVMTESILDGRLNLDYGDMDPRLAAMDNPYSRRAREELGVNYHFDHAFYNGQYYMYYGVVPVFLLFLPYRVLTGVSLTTYHATQIFTALFILGVFALFRRLSREYFRRMPLSVYLSLSAAVSAMSVWYFTDAPAMYCTAIAAGICMEIWSLYFFLKAVRSSGWDRERFRMAILGSLFGALSFGCRPTVALVNVLVVPLILYCLIKRHVNWSQLIAVFSPFAAVGVLLMIYNYVRFENPFEFGQTYQLTSADQSSYGNLLSRFEPRKIVNGLLESFISYVPLEDTFPYIGHQSVLLNFPVCFVGTICLLQKDSLILLKKDKLALPLVMLFVSLLMITVVQVMQSPWLLERYHSDIYWIVGILLFLSFGIFLETFSGRSHQIFAFIISALAILTVLRCFFLWAVPWDKNFTALFPERLEEISRVLRFGA